MGPFEKSITLGVEIQATTTSVTCRYVDIHFFLYFKDNRITLHNTKLLAEKEPLPRLLVSGVDGGSIMFLSECSTLLTVACAITEHSLVLLHPS